MKTSIILNYKTLDGTAKQKSYTDINSDATNKELVDFARAANQLTNNIYGSTTRIDKTNCDTEGDS